MHVGKTEDDKPYAPLIQEGTGTPRYTSQISDRRTLGVRGSMPLIHLEEAIPVEGDPNLSGVRQRSTSAASVRTPPGSGRRAERSKGGSRGGSALRQEQEKPWYILVPRINTRIRRYLDAWDALVMAHMVIAGYTIPFNVSLPAVNNVFLDVFNRMLDIVFSCDMFITFFTAYRLEAKWFAEEIYITNQCSIAKRYMGIPLTNNGQNGWFWLDLVTVLPGWVDLFNTRGSWSRIHKDVTQEQHLMDMAHMLRFLRIFRVMRLLRLAKIMDEVRVQFGISYFTTDLMKFLFIISLVAHWAACLWICVEGKVTMSVLPIARQEDMSWLSALIAAKGDPCSPNAREDPACVYSIAVYWAIMTLTGIGYGDITPANHMEYIVCAGFMVVAALVWTYIVASVVSVLSSVNPHEAVFKQRIDELNGMMITNNLPQQLRVDLRRFMLESRHIESLKTQKHLLDHNISSGLSGKVAELSPVTDIFMDRVFWAKDLDKPALLAIVSSFEACIYSAHEHIPIHERMIIIQSGLCTTSNGVLGCGDVYGIRSVLLETVHLIAEYPPFTLSFTDLLALKKGILKDICCQFPKADERLRKAQVRTAVWRSFVVKAQGIQHDLDLIQKENRKLKNVTPMLRHTGSHYLGNGTPRKPGKEYVSFGRLRGSPSGDYHKID